MAGSDKIEMNGHVTKILKGGQFIVTLDDNGMDVKCTLAGKLRQYKIKIILNDSVIVGISPYDLTRGIITWRNK